MRRAEPTSLEADREAYEKTQFISIQKAISQKEVPPKEKHVRTAILGTYQEKGAHTFWIVVRRLSLSNPSYAVSCWKFFNVLHKLLRGGHENTLQSSFKHVHVIQELGRVHASRSVKTYGPLTMQYSNCMRRRMEFQMKYSKFSGTLSMIDKRLEEIGKHDINTFYKLCEDILDLLDTFMTLQEGIFKTLDFSRAVSMTSAGQCRLAPCIPVILDTSQLYDYLVKLLFKLHESVDEDALCGHRERFLQIYGKLKKFYNHCNQMQYFKSLIHIPTISEEPPDFLRKLNQAHQLGPARMLDNPTPVEDRTPSPEPELVAEPLATPTNFNDLFGTMEDFSFQQEHDPRETLIAQLREEIGRLNALIAYMTQEHAKKIQQLLDRISELEKRLLMKETDDKSNRLQVQALQGRLYEADKQIENAVRNSNLIADVEKKAMVNEDLYKKMKEKHMNLVKDHALLLRKNADAQKQTESLQQTAEDGESKRSQLLLETEKLQQTLVEREKAWEQSEKKRQDDAHALFVSAVEAAEAVIRKAISAMDDSVNAQSTCSAASLMKTVGTAVLSLNDLGKGVKDFIENNAEINAIKALSAFGYDLAQTLVSGIATCHLVSDENGKDLDGACRSCGKESLSHLLILKNYHEHSKDHVVSARNVEAQLQRILSTTKDLLPKMTDVMGGDLQDLVEHEMSSTSKAIESAASRIEEMLREARERDTGINLEVNERILDSCTSLMQAIRVLIIASKELQREIVDEGRGASSVKEFYMKNSRWTEGLISAAKAVGFGATLLTDSADHAVMGQGKFEEIIVCSHEIAASTAQLVAASRVKANKISPKLPKLQKASKDVNAAAGRVVASTNAGRKQIDSSAEDVFTDLSKSSLTQIKRKEMDSQVHILELEQNLQDERIKLGKLRKQHYILAAENEEEEPQPEKHNGNNNNMQENKAENATGATKSVSVQRQKPPLPIKPTFVIDG